MNFDEIAILRCLGNLLGCYMCCSWIWCADRRLVVWLPKPKIRLCSCLVSHDPKLNFPFSLHDQTHTNKCLNNLLVGHKLYLGLNQESWVMPPSKTIPLFSWCRLRSLLCLASPCGLSYPLSTWPRKDMSDHFLEFDAFDFLMSIEGIST